MATFGYTTQGASLEILCGSVGDDLAAMKGVAINGSLTSVSAYIRGQDGSTSFNYQISLYSDSGGVPGVALVSSPVRTFAASATPTLVTENLSFSMVGSNYWAVIAGFKTGLDNGRLMFDAGGVAGSAAYNDTGSGWTTNSNRYSLYATYTPSAGSTGWNIALV